MRHNILDHGYIQLVETWGSDRGIIEAARMSTDKGFLGWGTEDEPGDERLLSYLYRHKHATPFEMAGAIFEIQAPIFVFREWHRHRTQSYNEMSGRYIKLPPLYYVPSIERAQAARQGKTNKQGSRGGFTPDVAKAIRKNLEASYSESRSSYEHLLGLGVAKEVARMCLPVSQYSRMRASANLRNWLAFLTLRTAKNAQWEIRQYANALGSMLEDHFPRTIDLFCEHGGM